MGHDFYTSLNFPVHEAPSTRPYTFINMIATIDGKTVSGERGEPVEDLGSEADKTAMRRIQAAADGVLIGAASQRSSRRIWYGKGLLRFVVTRSGRVQTESRFFSDAPDKAVVVCPNETRLPELPDGVRELRAGETDMNWRRAFELIRKEFGVSRLLVEGGSDVNGQILREDLVDELFLTIAPKVKLGESAPTYAGGTALPRGRLQNYELVEEHRWENELFLRYHRRRD